MHRIVVVPLESFERIILALGKFTCDLHAEILPEAVVTFQQYVHRENTNGRHIDLVVFVLDSEKDVGIQGAAIYSLVADPVTRSTRWTTLVGQEWCEKSEEQAEEFPPSPHADEDIIKRRETRQVEN